MIRGMSSKYCNDLALWSYCVFGSHLDIFPYHLSCDQLFRLFRGFAGDLALGAGADLLFVFNEQMQPKRLNPQLDAPKMASGISFLLVVS